MENPEDGESILGKKVFFLFPPSVVRDELISKLIEQEYEVYVLKSVETATTLIRRYPNSIVYVNIDAGLAEREWEEWVRRVKNDPAQGATGIGIVSYNPNEDLQKKYLMDIGIQYGYIKLKLGLAESAKILLATLKASEAKGRRRYVRASCAHDTVSQVNIREGQNQITGTLRDISVVGFSCVLDPDPGFKKNAILHDIQLKLKASILRTEAIVFGSRAEDDGHTVYVFLFTKKTDDIAREKIRSYIQATLQAEIEQEAVSPGEKTTNS